MGGGNGPRLGKQIVRLEVYTSLVQVCLSDSTESENEKNVPESSAPKESVLVERACDKVMNYFELFFVFI